MDEVFQQEQDEQAQEEQELAEYRYRLLLEAFTELLEKQVSNQTLEILRFETGMPVQAINQMR